MWNNNTMTRMITKAKMTQTMMINNIIKNKKANNYTWTSNQKKRIKTRQPHL